MFSHTNIIQEICHFARNKNERELKDLMSRANDEQIKIALILLAYAKEIEAVQFLTGQCSDSLEMAKYTLCGYTIGEHPQEIKEVEALFLANAKKKPSVHRIVYNNQDFFYKVIFEMALYFPVDDLINVKQSRFYWPSFDNAINQGLCERQMPQSQILEIITTSGSPKLNQILAYQFSLIDKELAEEKNYALVIDKLKTYSVKDIYHNLLVITCLTEFNGKYTKATITEELKESLQLLSYFLKEENELPSNLSRIEIVTRLLHFLLKREEWWKLPGCSEDTRSFLDDEIKKSPLHFIKMGIKQAKEGQIPFFEWELGKDKVSLILLMKKIAEINGEWNEGINILLAFLHEDNALIGETIRINIVQKLLSQILKKEIYYTLDNEGKYLDQYQYINDFLRNMIDESLATFVKVGLKAIESTFVKLKTKGELNKFDIRFPFSGLLEETECLRILIAEWIIQNKHSPEFIESLQMLYAFLTEKPSLMHQLSHEKIALELLTLIFEPNQISQEGNVCGVSIFLRELAEKSPLRFVMLGINLAKNSASNVPFEIKSLAEHNRTKSISTTIMWAIRHVTNTIFGYCESSLNEALAGVTFPKDLDFWFKKCGFKILVNSITFYNGNGEALGWMYNTLLKVVGYSNQQIQLTPSENIETLLQMSAINNTGCFVLISNEYFKDFVKKIMGIKDSKIDATLLGVSYDHYIKIIKIQQENSISEEESDEEDNTNNKVMIDMEFNTAGKVHRLYTEREYIEKIIHGILVTEYVEPFTLINTHKPIARIMQ